MSASGAGRIARFPRRWVALAAITAIGLVCGLISLTTDPALSPVEHRLVGEWGHPQIDSPMDIGIAAPTLVRPWHVEEFGPDRSFRSWYVSGDDPGRRHLVMQGRWRIVGDKLHFEDLPVGTRRVARDLGTWARERTYLGRTQLSAHPHEVPFRLEGNELVVAAPAEELPVWRRLPKAPGPLPDLGPRMIRRSDAFPDWDVIPPGSRWIRRETPGPVPPAPLTRPGPNPDN